MSFLPMYEKSLYEEGIKYLEMKRNPGEIDEKDFDGKVVELNSTEVLFSLDPFFGNLVHNPYILLREKGINLDKPFIAINDHKTATMKFMQ